MEALTPQQYQAKQRIEMINYAPGAIWLCLAGGDYIPFLEKGLYKCGAREFLEQRDVLNHFKGKNVLKNDVFESACKKLDTKTVEYLKNNKKYDLKAISKGCAKSLGILAGLYILAGLAIHHLKKAYNISD